MVGMSIKLLRYTNMSCLRRGAGLSAGCGWISFNAAILGCSEVGRPVLVKWFEPRQAHAEDLSFWSMGADFQLLLQQK